MIFRNSDVRLFVWRWFLRRRQDALPEPTVCTLRMHFTLIPIQRHELHFSQFTQSHQATATRVSSTILGPWKAAPTMDTFHTSSSCYSLPLQCTTVGLHPQSARHSAWQPSARVSQTFRPSYLSHPIVATTYVDNTGTSIAQTAWHTDLRALDFAHYHDSWYRSRLANVACAWSWRVCEINPTILTYIPPADI